MKYQTLNEWCKDFECHIISKMITYDEILGEYDSGRALLFCNYLSELLKWLEEKDESFKKKLIDTINAEHLYNFTGNEYHFFLIYNIVHYNHIMGVLYKDGIPYPEDKWLNKAQTKNEKNIKNKKVEICSTSPKEHLVKFKSLSEEILNNFDFHTYYNTRRLKIKERNIIIDTLIDLIVSDNYAQEIHHAKGERVAFCSDMRNTKKTQDFIQAENEIEKLKIENKKQYYKTIPPKK